MLYSAILGSQNGNIRNDWFILRDGYGNTFISNESIRQKIRIGRNVDDSAFKKEYSMSNISSYYLPSNTFISNNNKNMNLSLMNYWTDDKKDREQHKDDDILFVTLNSENYVLSHYECDESIIQTYKKKDSYQGCAIKFSDNEIKEKTIIAIYCMDVKINRFVKISVELFHSLNKDEKRINIIKTVLTDKEQITKCKKYTRQKSIRHFKIKENDKQFLTSAYIVSSDYSDRIKEMTKDIPNQLVITWFDMEEYEDIKPILESNLIENRVRAVTIVGRDIPHSFCKDFSILYLFKYDMGTNELITLKSN